jgi:putative DNA primase/helicase
MVKVKIIKEGQIYPVGKILNVSPSEAEESISDGLAIKYVEENTEEQDKILSIKIKLKDLLSKDPIDQDLAIRKLAEESGIARGVLNKQLEKLKSEIVNKENENKNIPLENLNKGLMKVFDKKQLAEYIIDLQPVYYDPARNWWLWDYTKWKWTRTDETDILNAIEKQASVNTINSKERNEILEALKQVSRKYAPKPITYNWVQFNDTLFDIETGERKKANKFLFVTNPIPWDLHEEDYEETPVMDRIFEEWVGKENVKKLYEIIAYCMIPDYPIHRIFCFIGSGMNGKSKYLQLLRRFIGVDNCCSTELDTLLTSRFEVTRLHKKLVCQMGETNFNEMSKTSLLKKLSGGDLIGFEYKGKDPFEDINTAKLIIATNNLPSTTDKTIGFYRRWMIIDFPNQFSEAKDILAEIPIEEYKALALKCCHILKELLETRKFTNEGSVEERMKSYEDHSNPLEKFLKENTEEDPDGYIWKFEFEEKLNSWCKDNRFRELSDVAIGKKMKEMNANQQLIMNAEAGKQWRAWVGIKWKEVANQDNQDNQVYTTQFHIEKLI